MSVATALPDAGPARAVLARTAAADRRRRRSERAVLWVGTGALGAAILLFWQFGLGHLVNPRYVSDPATIGARIVELAAEGAILTHVGVTIGEAAAGFVIGSVLGLASAFALAQTRRGYAVFEPFLVGFYSIPKIALAPLFILWFGIGLESKVFLGASLVFFVVLISTEGAINAVDPEYLKVVDSLGAKHSHRLTRVILPSIVPPLFSGLRVGVIYSLLGVVTAEMVASRVGLGQQVVYYSSIFRTDGVMAILFVLAIVALIINAALEFVERRLNAWRA
jgi:NitT/TauT family transport system permease protein